MSVAPLRPSEYAEQELVRGLLDGTYSPGTTLPGERELAAQLGITRPTLREALVRLERDGWITVRQGKPTAVNDFWQEGGLNILGALVSHADELPPDFVSNLLGVRLALAPAYARAAIERAAPEVVAFLATADALPDTPEAFAAFDWKLHRVLTGACGNPVFRLVLNGFGGVYEDLALLYFALPSARAASRTFYAALRQRGEARDAAEAERLTRVVMQESIRHWARATAPDAGPR